MNLRVKNAIYSLGLVAVLFLVWNYRQKNKNEMVAFGGETMGTSYHIKYFDAEKRILKVEVDSLLELFNQSLSTYIPTSEVSRFNKDSVFEFESEYFYEVLNTSAKVHQLSKGTFDPTVMPLVNAWGFGPEQLKKIDSTFIDSLKTFVGFEKVIDFDTKKVWKNDRRSTLDFSAIAKGYGVDIVTNFIKSKGIENVFVEIGGEVFCAGKNLQTGNPWRLAIIDPDSEILNPTFIAQLDPGDKGVATSANNFNYRIVDGVKYSHTISPYSGYPIKQAILSATVVADDCMTADAFATAFMVMGHEKAIDLINNQSEVNAFLIFSDSTGKINYFVSDSLKNKLNLLNK